MGRMADSAGTIGKRFMDILAFKHGSRLRMTVKAHQSHFLVSHDLAITGMGIMAELALPLDKGLVLTRFGLGPCVTAQA